MNHHRTLATTCSTPAATIERFENDLAWTRPLADNDPLVPAEYCRQVLAERPPAGCGIAAAERLGRALVGSYPAREVNDPRAYALAIASVFADYPEEIGSRAVSGLIRSLKFLPTAADVHEACEALMAPARTRRAMAQRMLREHERRAAEAPVERKPVTPEQKATLDRELETLKRNLAMPAAAKPPRPYSVDLPDEERDRLLDGLQRQAVAG